MEQARLRPSAGRVQSVALRLIVDREREIEAFVPEEYWNCGAALAPATDGGGRIRSSRASCRADGEKLEVKNGDEAAARPRRPRDARATASPRSPRASASATRPRRTRRASSSRTRSTAWLRRQAHDADRAGALRGHRSRQGRRRPGRSHHVHAYRLDPRLARRGRRGARATSREYGKEFVPAQPNVFKSKKNAQDAHEAIRPTSLELTPESVRKHLKDEQFKLYKLIWDRFVACQMTPAVYDQTSVDIEAKPADATRTRLRPPRQRPHPQVRRLARGRTARASREVAPARTRARRRRRRRGRRRRTARRERDAKDRRCAEDDARRPCPSSTRARRSTSSTPPGVITEQKFTQPPPRYNEARSCASSRSAASAGPSTYAEIISKVQARDYVEKIDGGALPPDARSASSWSTGSCRASSTSWTRPSPSKMEEELDEVEAGKEKRVDLLKRFYKRFREQLDKSKKLQALEPRARADRREVRACDGGVMLKRWSQERLVPRLRELPRVQEHARPRRRTATPHAVPRETGIVCDKCGKPMVIRSGRFGEFLSCTGYPECKNAQARCRSASRARSAAATSSRSARRSAAAGRSTAARTTRTKPSSATSSSGRSPSPSRARTAARRSSSCGGTRTKPMIACANKECGYKRAVAEPGETVVPAVAAASRSAPPCSSGQIFDREGTAVAQGQHDGAEVRPRDEGQVERASASARARSALRRVTRAPRARARGRCRRR